MNQLAQPRNGLCRTLFARFANRKAAVEGVMAKKILSEGQKAKIMKACEAFDKVKARSREKDMKRVLDALLKIVKKENRAALEKIDCNVSAIGRSVELDIHVKGTTEIIMHARHHKDHEYFGFYMPEAGHTASAFSESPSVMAYIVEGATERIINM